MCADIFWIWYTCVEWMCAVIRVRREHLDVMCAVIQVIYVCRNLLMQHIYVECMCAVLHAQSELLDVMCAVVYVCRYLLDLAYIHCVYVCSDTIAEIPSGCHVCSDPSGLCMQVSSGCGIPILSVCLQ